MSKEAVEEVFLEKNYWTECFNLSPHMHFCYLACLLIFLIKNNRLNQRFMAMRAIALPRNIIYMYVLALLYGFLILK